MAATSRGAVGTRVALLGAMAAAFLGGILLSVGGASPSADTAPAETRTSPTTSQSSANTEGVDASSCEGLPAAADDQMLAYDHATENVVTLDSTGREICEAMQTSMPSPESGLEAIYTIENGALKIEYHETTVVVENGVARYEMDPTPLSAEEAARRLASE